jgi:rhamnulokinase
VSTVGAGQRILAVDLGATSIRVAAIDLSADTPTVEVLHRHPHAPVRWSDGSLRWDWARLLAEVEVGLAKGLASGPVASIGVDGWAVDYGLLGADGRLLSPPYSYRDQRVDGWQATADRIGPERLYGRTGIQLMPINTIFQLAAHDRAELEAADRLVLLPDLVVHHLTGAVVAERSNASTTSLLDPRTGVWSDELCDAIGLRRALLPEVVEATAEVGIWREVPVHLVGSHDTASAFVGVPGIPRPGTAIVSSGTWVLVGAERSAVDTSNAARRANFSNELGALGGVRFLRNVMGFWMLEQCRRSWGDPPIEALVAEAAAADEVPTVDALDQRFRAPADMEAEVRAAADLRATAGRAEVVSCILHSIAGGVARVVDDVGALTGTPIEELLVVGGGVRMGLMNELLAAATGCRVTVGSPEAAALGNAVVQGIALGSFDDLADARRWLASGASDPGAAPSTPTQTGERRPTWPA